MDIDAHLRRLESCHGAASRAAAAAKGHYLSLVGDPSISPTALERAKLHWQQLDSRKRTIAAQMGEIEEIDQDAIA